MRICFFSVLASFIDIHSDNLYLDFNGISPTVRAMIATTSALKIGIQSSHPNDDDAHFRLSEEQIFTSIFAYVDHLFGKIKPQKLFFMAVDGVASWEKMDQNKPDGFEPPRRRGRLDTRRWPRARRERVFYHPRFAVLDMK